MAQHTVMKEKREISWVGRDLTPANSFKHKQTCRYFHIQKCRAFVFFFCFLDLIVGTAWEALPRRTTHLKDVCVEAMHVFQTFNTHAN